MVAGADLNHVSAASAAIYQQSRRMQFFCSAHVMCVLLTTRSTPPMSIEPCDCCICCVMLAIF
jgi:hypothetical protein